MSQVWRLDIPTRGDASGKGAKKAGHLVASRAPGEEGSNISGGPEPALQELLEELRACRDRPGGGEVRALMGRLRAIARRHLPPKSRLRRGFDSEDLAQEGLLQLLANLERFRGNTLAEFVSFAGAVIGQQAAKQARWQGVRDPELRGGEDAASHATEHRTPSADAISEERRARLRALVDDLGEPYRSSLQMRLEGMSNAAIADALGVREDLVRKRLSRALKELHGKW